MILHLFRYFARFPRREGVLSIFTNGTSTLPSYARLQQDLAQLPPPLLPQIDHYVFGQSFDDVKRRLDTLTGNFLFVDFGEISSSRNQRNAITDTQRIAITIAVKIPDSSDLVEMAIHSSDTLALLTQLRTILHQEQEGDNHPWLTHLSSNHEIVPFLSPELHSIGWTLLSNISAADFFHIHASIRKK